MIEVGDLVDMVRKQELQLPEIQRAYVWKRPQVRDLLDSLYRGYPIGTMLLWQTDDAPVSRIVPGSQSDAFKSNPVRYILDGQQRLTSLSRVFADSELDIRFNVETEEFQVANAVIRRDPQWIRVQEVFEHGASDVWLTSELHLRPDSKTILGRVNRLEHMKKIGVPVNILSAFNYEEVTEIFVRVNSKGTRLRAAELAIAQLAFRLPGLVTEELKVFEDTLEETGWDLDLPFLIRCLTAVATNQARFAALPSIPADLLLNRWSNTRKAIETFLNLLDKNLGVESTDWLPSTTAMVLPVVYLARQEPKDVDVSGLLRWFLLATIWARYSGASETALDQDLRLLAESSNRPFEALTDRLKQISNGRLLVEPADLDDASTGSPFFLMAYLACRQQGAQDWWTGVKLSSTNLGTNHLLEIHHIFPKAIVGSDYPRQDVNEIANLAFLSKQANLQIGKQEPYVYFPGIEPERLARQFIPQREELQRRERFQEFLAERRILLADGINSVLKQLSPLAPTEV
jgi:hypothetical protein